VTPPHDEEKPTRIGSPKNGLPVESRPATTLVQKEK